MASTMPPETMRPPGIDVTAHVGEAALPVGEMRAQGPAATLVRGEQGLNTRRIEHPPGRAMNLGPHRRLHAAPQQQHLAPVFARLEFAERGVAV